LVAAIRCVSKLSRYTHRIKATDGALQLALRQQCKLLEDLVSTMPASRATHALFLRARPRRAMIKEQ
jgi:hypothetical protein